MYVTHRIFRFANVLCSRAHARTGSDPIGTKVDAVGMPTSLLTACAPFFPVNRLLTKQQTDELEFIACVLSAGGTCKEFSPVFHRLASEMQSGYRFGQVDIDEKAGMDLAVETEAIEVGVPSVWAYKEQGDRSGILVWSGDEVPQFDKLAAALSSAL
jgi:hypothetical protein